VIFLIVGEAGDSPDKLKFCWQHNKVWDQGMAVTPWPLKTSLASFAKKSFSGNLHFGQKDAIMTVRDFEDHCFSPRLESILMKKPLTLLTVCALVCSFTVIASAQQQRQGGNRGQGNVPGNAPMQPQGPVNAEGAIDLFASKDLADWDFFLLDGAKKEDIFSFNDDGILHCKGEPFGWLCTKEKYRDYKLTVQWRWPEGVEPTNSGIFLRMNGETKGFLPRAVEVQLQNGNAGDLWAFFGMGLAAHDNARFTHNTPGRDVTGEIRGIKKLVATERPTGRWNTMDIVCQGRVIVVSVNGTIVNWTKDVEDVAGPVGLQSEGGPIEFRNMFITPLSRAE
jgi:hypothetical protein